MMSTGSRARDRKRRWWACYTGKLWEEELLDRCLMGHDGQYVPYKEAMDIVRQWQPPGWDPGCPRPRFAQDLHALVAEKLELEDWNELKFYTAVGSVLDRFHGVDGFFEWRGVVVTIDVTLNSAKADYKADFVIYRENLERPEGLEEEALEIAALLFRKRTRFTKKEVEYAA